MMPAGSCVEGVPDDIRLTFEAAHTYLYVDPILVDRFEDNQMAGRTQIGIQDVTEMHQFLLAVKVPDDGRA